MTRKKQLIELMQLREKRDIGRVAHKLAQMQANQNKADIFRGKIAGYLDEKCAEGKASSNKYALWANQLLGHKLAEQLHQTDTQAKQAANQMLTLRGLISRRRTKMNKLGDMAHKSARQAAAERDAKEDNARPQLKQKNR